MKFLHIEDCESDADAVRRVIASEWPDSQVVRVRTREDCLRDLADRSFDVILSDDSVPGLDGFEALQLARERAPDTPFIFVCGSFGEERAKEAVRLGAEDYVLKDRIKRLLTSITRAVRDAGERQRRRKAEDRIRELVDSLNQAREAVIVTDLQGRITFWNQGAARLSGWAPHEAIDRTSEDLFDSETIARLSTACRTASSDGELVGDFELRDRAGRLRTAELRITVIHDEEGHAKSRLVLATDITERRLAERRVREQAEMLNQAREAIFITDLDNRIIYWNAGAERQLGWPAAEALGRTAEHMIDPTLLPPIQAARAETYEKGEWCGELRMNNRNGESVIVESRQTLIRDEARRPKARLCINGDITERKRLEQQFLRAQRMENLGLLAAGIAHDLNNMLAPILLAAPMLRDYAGDPAALKLLDTLEKSADRGAQLVRQILSFAHGVGGDAQCLQVKHLMRDIVAVMSGTFPKSIRIEDYIPSELWPIKGNPTQIHQVLLNLCVNARDAMPNGGVLRISGENRVLGEAEAAEIEGARPGRFLVLQIEDTGVGIAPEILKHIWEPFFTTKSADRGTGLGLSTARGIIIADHGFAEVRSRPGEGSLFRIFLPAVLEESPAGSPDEQTLLPRGCGELILVVDDEQEIRGMTSELLGRNGYRVLLAADGAEAAALFAKRASEIRLVISDLHMPNLDGSMLAHALRQINPAIRVLFISGMASSLDSTAAVEPDELANPVLLKPFKSESLLRKVHEILNPAQFAAA